MKTSELTGAALDWAVDKVEGRIRPDGGYYCGNHGRITKWSTDWAQGGPIIEREKILLNFAPDVGDDPEQFWVADDYAGLVSSGIYWGSTPLEAAMRCYVASKLGDEVEVPEELT
jgi:hypothetical protein